MCTKIMITWCTVPKIWCAKDRQTNEKSNIQRQVPHLKKETGMTHTWATSYQFEKWNFQIFINIKKYKIVFKIRKYHLRIIFFLMTISEPRCKEVLNATKQKLLKMCHFEAQFKNTQVFVFLTTPWFTKSVVSWWVLVHETGGIFEYIFWTKTHQVYQTWSIDRYMKGQQFSGIFWTI